MPHGPVIMYSEFVVKRAGTGSQLRYLLCDKEQVTYLLCA